MNPNLEENFIVYSGRVPSLKLGAVRQREKRNEGRDERTFRYAPCGMREGGKGRPKSLDFIAGLNGLQSNACTTRREIARPSCGHNFCRPPQIAIIHLKWRSGSAGIPSEESLKTKNHRFPPFPPTRVFQFGVFFQAQCVPLCSDKGNFSI